LVGLNPNTGTVRFEAPLSISRGTNDVERLTDIVGRVSRVGDSVCARSYQSSVGCVNLGRGTTLWTKASNGADGVHGDERNVYGVETDGRVVAWARSDGERRWNNEKLLHRGVGAPLAIGRSVAVGDAQGFVHFLSRDDGALIGRASTCAGRQHPGCRDSQRRSLRLAAQLIGHAAKR
jgi:outer membrane protein assembly factor BamB